MRSPAFRLTPAFAPKLNGSGLASVDEEDFLLDDDNSEHGSELGPLPASSPAMMGRRAHHGPSKGHPEHSQPPMPKTPEKPVSSSQSNADAPLSLLIYGLVNVAVSVPCLYGYAGIIYRDPAFQRAMPDLIKLVILSSAVHQLVFTVKSSMSFSISQVQDAGLIFLSAMASSIASRSASEEEAVATAVISLAMATTALGIVVMVVGKFRLASFVSLIPMPVVAGYLAFIGFFCFAAGLGLSCSKDISTYQDFAQLNELQDWILATPAMIAGGIMTLVSRKSPHWWALPVTIIVIPLVFYVVLFWFGLSLDDARVGGWVAPLDPPEPFYNVFLRFDFLKVNWSLVPNLVVTWASMTLLVTFASALDVVAVEMDLGGQELDLDEELKTVGLSNVISGLLGGYTGSYIFSMTIFTRRTGSQTRWIGIILAVVELFLFCAPFNLMSFVPRFFFAATLIFIAFDLMAEWLVAVVFRVSPREYLNVLLTFLAITFTEDLVLGILIGCLGAVVNFILAYSSINPVVPAQSNSNVLRDYEARKIVHTLCAERVISLKLSGFLFFGSTTQLLSRVREFIHRDPATMLTMTSVHQRQQSQSSYGGVDAVATAPQHRKTRSLGESEATLGSTEETPLLLPAARHGGESKINSEHPMYTRTLLGTALKKRKSASVSDLPSLVELRQLENRNGSEGSAFEDASSVGTATRAMSMGLPGGDASSLPPPSEEEPSRLNINISEAQDDEIVALEKKRSGGGNILGDQRKTRYLVLDFFAVTGVDATAVSTGLMRIRMLAKANNVKLVFAGLSPQFEKLFRANHVLGNDDVVVKQTLNDALDYCETEMLEEVKFDKEIGNELQSLKVLHTSRLMRYPREPSVPPVVFDDDVFDPIIVAQKKRAEKRARASLALLVDTFFGWGRGKPSLSPEQSKQLASYFVLRPKRQGSIIFDVSEESDSLYVVISGEVVLYKVSEDWIARSKAERKAVIDGTTPGTVFGEGRERMQRARYGSMIGDLSFTLQEKRSFGALAERDTTLFVLSRLKLREMETAHPDLAIGLYKMIGRSLGMTLLNLQQLAVDEEAD